MKTKYITIFFKTDRICGFYDLILYFIDESPLTIEIFSFVKQKSDTH
jgi:hypothetical protein